MHFVKYAKMALVANVLTNTLEIPTKVVDQSVWEIRNVLQIEPVFVVNVPIHALVHAVLKQFAPSIIIYLSAHVSQTTLAMHLFNVLQ